MSTSTHERARAADRNRLTQKSKSRKRWSAGWLAASLTIVAFGVILVVIAALNRQPGQGSADRGQDDQYPYAVGAPGVGETAPELRLPSTSAGTFDVSARSGKTVMLFFQEGIVCEPCWTQLAEIERNWKQFASLGIDEIVTITGDPLDALRTKAQTAKLETPVLSDAGLAASRRYGTDQYGMHAGSNGHSFIVVGPDGQIRWRADYGGPPNYTMYVPLPTLLADLRAGLGDGGEA